MTDPSDRMPPTSRSPEKTTGSQPEAGGLRTADPTAAGHSLLIVATVAATINGVLVPSAEHFRGLGWRVDAAARGAPENTNLVENFDHVYDLPLSRSIRDLQGLISGIRTLGTILETEPEIVHVHTPIAALLTRLMVRRMPASRRPKVAYTAHGP